MAVARRGGPAPAALLLTHAPGVLAQEELLRNPYALKMWLRYLDARKGAPPRKRYLLYERALRALPGSYTVRGGAGAGRWAG